MKKAYMKPSIEIEVYELDASIAGNCGHIITLGPGDYNDVVCDEFEDSFDVLRLNPTYGIMSSGTPFYDGVDGPVCDCYYTSGGAGYFTS